MVSIHISWSIGQLGKNKPPDVAAAQVLLNLAAAPGAPTLPIDGKMGPETLNALGIFQVKAMRLSRAVPCVDPNSSTVRALIIAAGSKARSITRLPLGKVTKMSDGDYQDAAKRLGCDAAAVRAVAEVESAGAGFLPSGKPKILFEAHVFSALTSHAYDGLFPDVSSRLMNRALYRGGEREYPRLTKAMLLDRAAAIRAASWGRFQILGREYAMTGQTTLDGFLSIMCTSERAQLDLFVAFMKSKGLVQALQSHDWATVALKYNGRGYQEKHYDARLKEEFERYSESPPIANRVTR